MRSPDAQPDLNDERRIEIAALRPGHLTALIELWTQSGLEVRRGGRDAPAQLQRQLSRNPEGFIGAFVAGRLVGFVLATDDDRRGWINRLAVHPDYRRQRLARRLIAAAEDVLKRRGMRIMAALIDDENIASIATFTAAGYVDMPDVTYYSKRDDPDV